MSKPTPISNGIGIGSLRRQLLTGILLPIAAFIVIETFSVYRNALDAVNTAYDRTLLASAKAIGELLEVEGVGPQAQIRSRVNYSALETFEADNRSRMVYRVSNANGEWVDGAQDLQMWRGTIPATGPYAALVDFYDDQFRGDAVRVAVLLQPVARNEGRGMATVQVAETLELRRGLARQVLIETLQRQAILIAVISAVVVLVVHRATQPVRRLSAAMAARFEGDLTPITSTDLPLEIQPLTDATNQVMGRLQLLLDNQKRFVRDAAHQLRTPLAVLKTQVQSAVRGDTEPRHALREMEATVNRATALANQMLALAKVEQLRQTAQREVMDWAEIVRSLALEMSPLIAEKDLDFSLETSPCSVRAHEWMLRELTRNLLHNAIRHCPPHTALQVRIGQEDTQAQLTITDSGSGISPELRSRLFQPFSSGTPSRGMGAGSGLGLTIAADIVESLHGSIRLTNRLDNPQGGGRINGLDAVVRIPLEES